MKNPTGQGSDTQTSVRIFVELTNSERQEIWSRNAAMIIANAFILSASQAVNSGLVLVLAITGFAMCLLWAIMTWSGWVCFYMYMRLAASFPTPDGQNPFSEIMGDLDFKSRDVIFICSMLLIILFALVYVARAGLYISGSLK